MKNMKKMNLSYLKIDLSIHLLKLATGWRSKWKESM
jgi:hypothetical protein